VAPFASFEAASAAVKEGVADAFLVPGAYPHLNGFIMDSELSALPVECSSPIQILLRASPMRCAQTTSN